MCIFTLLPILPSIHSDPASEVQKAPLRGAKVFELSVGEVEDYPYCFRLETTGYNPPYLAIVLSLTNAVVVYV